MPPIRSDNNRIAKNSIFLSIRMVIVLGLTLYTTRVLLEILGVMDYGTYNVVCGFVSMFAFINTSMSNGIQRFFNYELGKNGEEGANRVYCNAVLIQLFLSVIIILLTESFGLWYIHNKIVVPPDRMMAVQWIFQFSILSFLFVIMQAPYTAAVLAHERMDFFAIVSVLDAVLKLGIVYLLPILQADHLIMYGLLMLGISITNFILYFGYSRYNFSEIRFRKVYSKSLFGSMLVFSGWNLFGSFSGVMRTQGINLVINYFFGPLVNAARGIAVQVNAGMQGFVTSMTVPVRPQVIQSYARGDLHRSMHLTYSISKFSSCFLLMMAIPASLEINYILHIWLGDNVPDYASTFTVIILFTSLINNLNGATSGIAHATGKMRNYQLWGSLISMSSVPVAYFILTKYRIPEIALLSVVICAMMGHLVCLIVVKRLVGMSLKEYFYKVIWPITIVLVLSLLITLPVHYYMDSGGWRLVVVTFLGCTTVLLTIYYFGLDDSEQLLFKKLWNRLNSFVFKRIN